MFTASQIKLKSLRSTQISAIITLVHEPANTAEIPMATAKPPRDISVIGRAIYRERILPTRSTSDKGKVIFVDMETGGYEIDADECAAMARFMERFPNTVGRSERVGYPCVDRLGYFVSPSGE
jgi:hypothetical protein